MITTEGTLSEQSTTTEEPTEEPVWCERCKAHLPAHVVQEHFDPHGGVARRLDVRPRDLRCALCGHSHELWASVNAEGSPIVPLCHEDDHSCYVRWTVDGERPFQKRSAPNPRALERKTAELAQEAIELLHAAKALREPYAWALYASHQPTVIETSGTKSDIAYSDPTGEVAANERKEAARGACVEAVRALDRALKAIRHARKDHLEPALGRLPSRAPSARDFIAAREREREQKVGLGFATPNELSETARKQAERAERHVGFGEE